ncbi:MAG TPA: hypothetical protein VEC36_13735, partial [Patescibacteria group bacterium]|nr:hypothetical protein [Patescibacteria group bacterium]
IHTDYTNAPHNSFVLVSGSLFFMDKEMYVGGMAFKLIEKTIRNTNIKQMTTKQQAEHNNQLLGLEMYQHLSENMKFQTLFILQNEKHTIIGNIKEDGLSDPTSTFHVKHGLKALSNIHVIGIKEPDANEIKFPEQSMFGVGALQAGVMKHFTDFPNSIPLTPLAIFRKLLPQE